MKNKPRKEEDANRCRHCRILAFRGLGCAGGLALCLILAFSATGQQAKTGEEAVLMNLPDPFLSYLVRRQLELQRLQKERLKIEADKIETAKRHRLMAEARLASMKEPRTELQRIHISQLTVTAIVQAKDGAWALVRDPKGTGYVVKKGTPIGTEGGVVEAIVRQAKATPFGKEYTRAIIIKEPYLPEGEVAIQYKTVEMTLPDQVYP